MSDKHRISRVTTATGDAGETGLADGSRLSKDAPAVVVMGELDELNAALGVLRSHKPDAQTDALLHQLQQTLFDLGAELALPGVARLTADHVAHLSEAVERLNGTLPPLKEFVLPGGTPIAAWCHYVRTVARRCERHLVACHRQQPQNPHSLAYINRLSDLLFVLARALNHQAAHPETLWSNTPWPA